MPATVTLNLPTFPPLVDQALLRDIGDLAVRMIRTRTQQGIDRTGAAFAPYTPGYAEKKAKEVGAGPVNLTLSGRMLNDMGVTGITPGTVTIGFRSSGGSTRGKGLTMIQRSRAVGAEDKARAHDVTGAGKARTKREFLGLTATETETLRARVARHLDDVARRASRR
jgi:hypothetical protein